MSYLKELDDETLALALALLDLDLDTDDEADCDRVLEDLDEVDLVDGDSDEDLLEDVIIENKQAIEMVEMYSNILNGMMDTFASIISNNLNIVMNFLASMTIILAIPTMISSFFGMNVAGLPLAEHEQGFLIISGIAGVMTVLAAALLWRRGMFTL